MADCDYDGQPEEIDEFAMFRARALGAESEYLLMQQASRRGSPRPDSRQFQSNGAVNEQLSSSNISGSVASVDGQPMTRTSSGRRRHASGQGTSSSRARRAVQSSSAAAADNDESVAASRDQIQAVNGSVTTIDGCSSTSGQVRRRTAAGRQQLDRRTDSSSSGYQQKMLLVSPGSFDDDGDMNGLQRPLQRTHSCRSTTRSNNAASRGLCADYDNKMLSMSNENRSPTNHRAPPAEGAEGECGAASSKFNRNRTMTLPVRRRSRSSSAANRSSRAAGSDHSPQPQTGSRHDIRESEVQQSDGVAGQDVAVYRVRNFTTKSGNVVNRGDSIKIRNRGGGGGAGRGGTGATGGGRASPASAATASGLGNVQRSSSIDSHPSSPGGGAQRSSSGWSGMSARDRREVLSRHSSRGGGRSSMSGDDAQFPVSPSTSAVAAVLASEQPLLEAEVMSSTQTGLREADIDDVVADLDGRRRVQSADGRGRNGYHRDMATNGVDTDNDQSIPVYKVLVLGSQGVGKTTLVEQLMTSEYLANKENCVTEEESTDKTVSVQVDDEESVLQFIDIPGSQANKSRDLVDANLVIYSVTDRVSFQYAQSCLQELRPAKRHNVVILVANKQDIVRNRVISEEDGKSLAARRHCKFIEVSALLDHKMDELLVGITRQIRLRKSHPRAGGCGGGTGLADGPTRSTADGTSDAVPVGCLQRAAVAAFRKLFRRRGPTEATSCDDLFKP